MINGSCVYCLYYSKCSSLALSDQFKCYGFNSKYEPLLPFEGVITPSTPLLKGVGGVRPDGRRKKSKH